MMMGTKILKINAELAQKIEVEFGNPHLERNRNSEAPPKIHFLASFDQENCKEKQKLLFKIE